VPELPDIEVYADHLRRRVAGQPLQNVRVASAFLVRTFDPPLKSAFGKRVTGIRRMGKRIVFDLERVMRTRYVIDDFQQTYFVIDSFQKLLDECYGDFGPLYERIRMASDIEPHELIAGDKVLTRGTLDTEPKRPN